MTRTMRILTLLLLTMVGAGQMWADALSNPRVKFVYSGEQHGTAFASDADSDGKVTIIVTPEGDWRCIDGNVTAKVTANTNMAQAPRRTQAEVQIGDAIGVTCTATNVFTLTLPEDNNLHVTVTVSFSEKETYIPEFNIENWEYCGSESGANSPSIIELQPADVTVTYKYGTSWNNANSALVNETDFELNPPVAVGQYVMVAYVEGNADYNASHSDPVDFEIEPKTLTFGSSDVTGIEKEYDGTTDVANLDEIDIRPQGIVNNQDVEVEVVSGSYASKNVGNNIEVTIDEVNLTGTDKDNYRIDQNTSVKTTGIINQRTVKITGISVTPKVYDGETWADVDCNSAVFDKLVAGDDIRPDYLLASYDNANVGTNKRVSLDYDEYCTGLAGNDKDNYFLDRDGCVGETVGDITLAPVTVKADNKSKEWGTADDPTLTATVTGMVNNEDANTLIAYTIDRAHGTIANGMENSGEYTITPTGDATQGNYAVTYETGKFTIKGKPVTIKNVNDQDVSSVENAYTITQDQNGVTLTLVAPDAVTTPQTVDIPVAVEVDHVAIDRLFESGKAATVYLPLSIEVSKILGGTFHTFLSVDETATPWKVTYSEPLADDATLQAGTPYIFMPNDLTGGKIVVNNGNDKISICTANQNTNTQGQWEFIGTYNPIVWLSDPNATGYTPERAAEIGSVYGFAAEEKTFDGTDYTVGQFVKVGSGASIDPNRAYLKRTVAQQAPALGGSGRTAVELPSAMRVVILSANSTTGIVEMRNENEEMRNDTWHTLGGRRLQGKPSGRGMYIHNGRKEVIR